MALPSLIQPSFSAGELSPALWGRVDLGKYRAGAKVMRNFFALATGGAANRPGTEIVGRCKSINAFTPARLLPFAFNSLQTYALEFGNLYMRVIMDGGYVLEPSIAITGITQASPGVFNIVAHGWSAGNQIFLSGITGMVSLNSTPGFQALVASVVDANHVTLTDLDGNPINTTALPAYAGSGIAARVFTLTTPYAIADLPLLKYTQSADVMTLTHPNYLPQDLTRTQHWVWTLATINFASSVQVPTSAAVTALGGGATLKFFYVITALTDNPAEESVPTAAVSVTNVALNQGTGIVNNITWAAPASGPTPNRYNVYGGTAVPGTAAAPTIFGYIGQTTSLGFVDANIAPDFTQVPPTHQNPFASSNNPGCATYFDGRRDFAGSSAGPETVWMSQPGNYQNMDTRIPSRDDDAITAVLTSQQVNAIKHLVSMNALLALTSSGAWQISPGVTSDALTPSSIVAKPQAYNGCSDVPPLTIDFDVLYVQARQSRVRDLSFNFYVNIFTGDDKSVLSDHLFLGRQIREWCFAQEPYKLVHAVRDDGVLLNFTFLKEQDVYAWSRHDTNGLYNSVCSIVEGQEDAVYYIVTRTVPGVNGGKPLQYTERLHTRYMGGNPPLGIASDVSLAWFVDCGLQYGPNVNATAVLSPGLGACVGGTAGVLFNTDIDAFTGGMVGNVIRANGGMATITAVNSTKQAVATIVPWAPFAVVPNDPNIAGDPPLPTALSAALAALPGNWSCTLPVSTVTGLQHLEGMQVAILADGNVAPAQTVTNGAVSLPAGQAASIITVGLPYTCQLETLRLDVGEPTIQGKRKRVGHLTLMVQDTRGLKARPSYEPTRQANFPQLVAIKERTSQNYGQPIPLTTGEEWVLPNTLWSKEGGVFLQQDFPLPATLLAIVPEIAVGDTTDAAAGH